MADPMKIRASMMGDKVVVKVLMAHEMETGQRKDSAGKTIPAWFIQNVSATHNGKTEAISILVEKNPNALSAAFDIPGGTEPFVSTRVKMGQTSNVHALVKADGKYFYATKEIKVTLGGCGG